MTTNYAIEAHGLVKTFGSNHAVDGVDLQVATGSIYGLLGPNGCGKTTTIRLLSTLLRPDGGRATIFGHDVVREPTAVRQLLGVTGQYASVDETLSATENLLIFGRLLGLSTRAAKLKAAELLEEFGLTDAAKRPLKNFSGGMRRRLDLAASLIARPPLIFLDEPTTGLDPRTRNQMWVTIRTLIDAGSTVLLTTQYLEEADQLADRIAVIDRGKVVAEGTGDELKHSIGSSTLILRVADAEQTSRAAEIITHALKSLATVTADGRLTAPLTSVDTVTADGRLTAPLTSVDTVTDLLLALRQAGIDVKEFSVQAPSLDEVFLTLTGHGAGDQTHAESDADPRSTTTTLEKEVA